MLWLTGSKNREEKYNKVMTDELKKDWSKTSITGLKFWQEAIHLAIEDSSKNPGVQVWQADYSVVCSRR